ncbi:MAG: polysaccharide export protein [Proteobacteria bacterium]|nr:polysaccharide export protein [Pseudomonadota bacterium]MBU1388723.1 polysaccharide export protein [Pseudomonadota bacterium]MBU1543064.1 polysaccharide export protein [Pseudomonadota bacterium]MBU2429553.1 polysaccharide export protein [Pseudomonadota bacterium]MBU2480513.1 polysaccharide export protein [Pseudomonadota bacterium]
MFLNLKKWLIVCILIAACMPAISLAEEKTAAYKIGVGDVLEINTWKEPDLSLETAMVRSDGKITFPLIGDIQAQGATTLELKDVIEKKIKEYVEAPNVTVTLTNPASQKFYILGEVAKTGEYQIFKKITVMQAFALAGGFTEWAAKNDILLIRRSGGKEITITIKYKDILNGDFSKDIPLIADDTIIVP